MDVPTSTGNQNSGIKPDATRARLVLMLAIVTGYILVSPSLNNTLLDFFLLALIVAAAMKLFEIRNADEVRRRSIEEIHRTDLSQRGVFVTLWLVVLSANLVAAAVSPVVAVGSNGEFIFGAFVGLILGTIVLATVTSNEAFDRTDGRFIASTLAVTVIG